MNSAARHKTDSGMPEVADVNVGLWNGVGRVISIPHPPTKDHIHLHVGAPMRSTYIYIRQRA